MVESLHLSAVKSELAEGWILESLSALSGKELNMADLDRLFTSEDAQKAVEFLIQVNPIDIGNRDLMVDLLASISAVNDALQQFTKCSHESFHWRAVPLTKMLHEGLTPGQMDKFPTPRIAKTFFSNIRLLIKRGSLKGPAWTTRSVYEPRLLAAFHLFHICITAEIILPLINPGLTARIVDFLKYHPQPFNLKWSDGEEILSYCEQGGNERALVSGLFQARDVKLDFESKRQMDIGAEFYDRLDRELACIVSFAVANDVCLILQRK